MKVTRIAELPTTPTKVHYPANCAPLANVPMTSLPMGAIRAEGWLGKQLELMLDGITGRLPEYGKYFTKEENGWLHPDTKAGWEEVPYWLRGFVPLALLTEDERCCNLVETYVDALLQSQDTDGYFGPAHLKNMLGKNGQRITDVWPHVLAISALEDYYEAKHDTRILKLIERFYRFCHEMPEESFMPPSTKGLAGWGGLSLVICDRSFSTFAPVICCRDSFGFTGICRSSGCWI